MLVYSLNDLHGNFVREFKVPQNCSDITIAKHIEFDDKYKAQVITEEYEEGSDKDLAFASEMVKFWTGLTEQEVSLIPVAQIYEVANIIGNALNFQRTEKEITEFTHKGETYYLPQKGVAVVGDMEHYLQNITLGEWAVVNELRRAFGLMKKSDLNGIVLIIAILCRKRGEAFPMNSNEQAIFIKQRTELFGSLSVQDALGIAFFLSAANESLRIYFHTFREVASLIGLLRNTDSTRPLQT